jgi:protein SCO1
VRIVLVTVDPAHDTPPVMAEYVARFGPGVTGLTGDSASVARAMAGYGAYAMPPVRHGAHGGRATALLAHGAVVYGIDRAGNLRVVMSEGAGEALLRDDVRALARL